ncbi:hypothetical protein [Cryobacterium sp. CG_9.6]|uniref:hypothetical protein n=1 Tax=Cryobacterium sp. CG_9.6 TaxID=2760710 RepID=UPI002473E978|nr:hypothetical protein [Cryobacterium sp. CG_9.6]MDH6237049.1 hypothetical protein [Cryobacterium sp. CG_9.6]
MTFDHAPHVSTDLSDRRRKSIADQWTPETANELKQIERIEEAGLKVSPALLMHAGYIQNAHTAATTTNTKKDN